MGLGETTKPEGLANSRNLLFNVFLFYDNYDNNFIL